MNQPSLTRADVVAPRGLVLMLHGGSQHSHTPVTSASNQWRRSRAMQLAITRRLAADRVGSWLLRYRVGGWNAADGEPGSSVPDASWALAQVRNELGEVPVVLLGHSMGARTAVHVADDPSVVGVVALAPWLPPDDPIEAMSGRHFVAAHGAADRITSAAATRRYCDRVAVVAASARMHDMGPVGHYLLRRIRAWNRVAVTESLRVLG